MAYGQAPIVALPIRGFRSAKQRLAIDRSTRTRLAQALASHTVAAVRNAGLEPVVVSSSPEVVAWTAHEGLRRHPEPRSGGLNGAARSFVDQVGSNPWLILHADLPCLSSEDIAATANALTSRGFVLAPSYDGGTTAIGGSGTFPFSYGPASFHRHIAATQNPVVITRLGLQLDIDTLADLEAARVHPRGDWINRHLEVDA